MSKKIINHASRLDIVNFEQFVRILELNRMSEEEKMQFMRQSPAQASACPHLGRQNCLYGGGFSVVCAQGPRLPSLRLEAEEYSPALVVTSCSDFSSAWNSLKILRTHGYLI